MTAKGLYTNSSYVTNGLIAYDVRIMTPVHRIKKPSKVFIFADEQANPYANASGVTNYYELMESDSRCRVGNHHQGGLNIQFIDGHADWRKRREFNNTEAAYEMGGY